MSAEVKTERPIVAVVGPTASGKSDLGIALALRAGGEIINCDSVQVYREIEIESRKSLAALAEAIVAAFGFQFDHAFGFYSALTGRFMERQPKYELFRDVGEETDAGSVRKTRIETAFPNTVQKMLFLFDYGDHWEFRVEVIGFGEKVPRTRYPKVLAVVGEAPPQYPDIDEEDE